MTDDEVIEDRLRRTYAQVGARTTITARSALPVDLDASASTVAGRWAPRTRTAVASLVLAAIVVVGGVALIAHDGPHRLDVVGGPTTEPSTSTTVDPMRACPVSGVAPNGKTFGTMPFAPGATGPAPDYVGYTGGTEHVVGYIRIGPSSQAVYACDLKTRVGNIYPHKGFVPIGVDPATVPDHVSHLVTVNALELVVSDDVAMVEMVYSEDRPIAKEYARVGLGPGATITKVNDTPVTTGASLNTATAGVRPGDQVRIAWTDPAGGRHFATIVT